MCKIISQNEGQEFLLIRKYFYLKMGQTGFINKKGKYTHSTKENTHSTSIKLANLTDITHIQLTHGDIYFSIPKCEYRVLIT